MTLDCGERLHFDQQHAAALHGGGDDDAAGLAAGAVLFEEEIAGVGHFAQAFAGHFEQADFVRVPKRFFTQRTMRWE